jgi:hypothetical protein
VAGKGILTSEAVGAVATEGDDSGNGSKVQEEAPSSIPELHTSAMDIRPGLANDGKQGNVHSLTVAEVIHVIRGGGWSSGPMMTKPRTKEALGSDHKLCGRNHQMAKQNSAYLATSRWQCSPR